jgi:ParB-like chromosome segregation protein Spo0J
MKIECAHDELVELHKLVAHPKNPNKHPDKQIDKLAKIIDYQGQRHPVVVSKRSGFIVVGHGRLEAIKKLGWEKCAVNYQDFKDEAEEYSFIVSDNAIAEWASLDLAEINTEMLDLGPDFDVELLGIENFSIEPIEKYDDYGDKNKEINTDTFGDDLQHECPKCGFEFND